MLDRPAKLVFKFLATSYSVDMIAEDLRRQNIPFKNVARMKKGEKELDMVIVTTTREHVKVLSKVELLCEFSVKSYPYEGVVVSVERESPHRAHV